MEAWPHQLYAIDEVEWAITNGTPRVLLSIPTRGGKTLVAAELIRHWVGQGRKVAIYTNRRLLVEQLSEMLDGYGITHGVRAAGKNPDHDCQVQICSIQTEQAATKKAAKLQAEHVYHDASRIIIDEAHINTGPKFLEIMQSHLDAGASVLGLTATPIDLGPHYDLLIQAGTNSELRKCGALVPALHFAPDEPDLRAWKRLKKKMASIESETAEVTEAQARAMMMTPGIFGRVWTWFEKLNPDTDVGRRPTILFAPGVLESLWFAEQFAMKGVKAAHIDGSQIWVSSWDKPRPTTQRLRQEVLDGSEAGDIGVLCNRFVLREGIDAPWLAHGIFATVFGSIQTYLQSGGRLLGTARGLSSVTIQDHGGNWWRYGSLNADRTWRIDCTTSMIQGMRADALRNKEEPEPFRCPDCGLVCLRGRCQGCGWIAQKQLKSRPVVGTDGELRMMQGDIFRPRRIYEKSDGKKKWSHMYWRSRTGKGNRTFRAAFALFAQENFWMWPDPTWPLMPLHRKDMFNLVKDVDFEFLTPQEIDDGKEERFHEVAPLEPTLFEQWDGAVGE